MFRSSNNMAASQPSRQQMSKSSAGGPDPSRRGELAQEARENALKIKACQEQALELLSPDRLYVVLYIRKDPPLSNDFHWGFYHHKKPKGMKYHIKNISSGWITDYGETKGVFKSLFLCAVIQIASVPAENAQQLDHIMRTYDSNLNNIPGLTCRVWLFRILEILVEQGMVRCNDLGALEAECLNFGNRFMHGAAANDQPRPTVVSNVSS